MSVSVIPAYRVVKKFVKDVESMPADAALDSLWANLRTYVHHMLAVAEPPFAEMGPRMALSQLGDPDLPDLSRALEALESGQAKEVAETTLQRCAAELPRPDLSARVLLLPGDGQSRVLTGQMNGVFGVSLGAQATLLFLWPTADWQRWLGYTIAHEYYHLVRNLLLPRRMSAGRLVYQKTQEPETLLDAMVVEGMADAFALGLFADLSPASIHALSPEAELQVWPKVRRRLSASDSSEIRRFLFGDNDRAPAWTGYAIGYRVVKEYLAKHPFARPAGMVGMPARTVFEASQYHPSLVPA
ncbi:MAG: hypothetical protein HY681_12865 [Chloroflexi bacterium]|nr:hypothetical protein [Chloroflexota bacterium]